MKFSKFVGKASAIFAAAAPVVALAQGLSGAPGGLGVAQGGLVETVVNIINILLGLAGLVAVIYLIIGGITYITSRGSEEEAEKAKGTILYAIVGLVVIGLSAAIVNFVVGSLAAV